MAVPETIEYKGVSFTFWDVAGNIYIYIYIYICYLLCCCCISSVDTSSLVPLWIIPASCSVQNRPLWKYYFHGTQPATQGVVDSSDRGRIPLANKQDLPNAMTAAEMAQELGLHHPSSPGSNRRRRWSAPRPLKLASSLRPKMLRWWLFLQAHYSELLCNRVRRSRGSVCTNINIQVGFNSILHQSLNFISFQTTLHSALAAFKKSCIFVQVGWRELACLHFVWPACALWYVLPLWDRRSCICVRTSGVTRVVCTKLAWYI
jgi:hypothetical protein